MGVGLTSLINATISGFWIFKRKVDFLKGICINGIDIIDYVNPNGFIDYNDTATTSTPIILPIDTWTTMTNDGLGAFSNDNYAPNGVTELLNVSTGAIDIAELPLGSAILIRNDYTVTPSANNALLMFRYSLGGPFPYTLEKTVGRLDAGSGIPYRFSLNSDYIYAGDENTRNSPIVLQIKLSAAGTVVNTGTVIQVLKKGTIV